LPRDCFRVAARASRSLHRVPNGRWPNEAPALRNPLGFGLSWAKIAGLKGDVVEFRFNADEWEQLAPSERVRRCRTLAEQARQLSMRATPELKRAYLDLALQWSALADEMESETGLKSES